MQQESSSNLQQGEGISFLALALVLAKHKGKVVGLPVFAGVIALVVSLLLPKIYTATVRILPPQQKESSAAVVLGALAGTAGAFSPSIGQALGLRNPNELYAGVLRGHTIADRLIERFKLMSLYEVDTMVEARKELEKTTRITTGRDGLISVEVDDREPQRAANMANAFIEELDHLIQGLAVTEAAKQRLFFEKQLGAARDQLLAAEADLRQAIASKGIVGVDAQSRALLATTEQLRAQIAVKEIQIDAMRAFATEHNPEAVRLRQEIASMKAELASLEGGRPEAKGQASVQGLENIRKLRQVKFLEFTVELLTKQYEIARIDEAKDAVLIQVVDKAVPPDYKSKPKCALIVVLTVLASGIVAILWALVHEAIERSQANPDTQRLWSALRAQLRLRRGTPLPP